MLDEREVHSKGYWKVEPRTSSFDSADKDLIVIKDRKTGKSRMGVCETQKVRKRKNCFDNDLDIDFLKKNYYVFNVLLKFLF